MAIGLALSATAWGCSSDLRPPPPDPYSVVFQLDPVDARTPERVAWLATYERGGKVARFRIELEPEPRGASLPAFTKCALVREPDSDASTFLEELARALEGRVPPPGHGVEAIETTAALLGRDLSRGGSGNLVAGAFGTEPKGTWIATKLFLGEDQSEVFLNLDPIGRYGELSMKDSTYGRGVLRELGRLLQGEVEATASEPAIAETPAPSVAEPSVPSPPPKTPDRDAARIAAWIEKAGPGGQQWERREALENLAKMGPRARDAVPVFLEALEDEDPLIRSEALFGLPALRPDPRIAIDSVTPLLSDSYLNNQVRAAMALADFGETSTATAHLTSLLRSEAKTAAATGLARLGPEARIAVPLLIEMLEERQDSHEGYAACMALAAIGRDAASALPALQEASQDSDAYVRNAASYAIGEIDGR